MLTRRDDIRATAGRTELRTVFALHPKAIHSDEPAETLLAPGLVMVVLVLSPRR